MSPTPEFETGTSRDVEPYLRVIRRFARGESTPEDFESEFFTVTSANRRTLPGHAWEIVEEVFYAAEDYVDDAELRARVGGIGPEAMHRTVCEVLPRLEHEYAAIVAAESRPSEA